MSYTTVNGLLTGVADAIRAKDGTSAAIATQDMPAKIADIPTGELPPQLPSDWPDIHAIVAADVQAGYTYKTIALVPTTLAYSTRLYTGSPQVGYKQMDGVFSTINRTNGSFNPAYNIPCSEGYSVQWVIFYYNSATASCILPVEALWIDLYNVTPINAINNYPLCRAIDGVVTPVASLFNSNNSQFRFPSFTNSTITGGGWFIDCAAMHTIPSGLNFATATNANSMFSGCNSLKRLPDSFGTITTGGVDAFFGCRSAINLPLYLKANGNQDFSTLVAFREKESLAVFNASGDITGGMVYNMNTPATVKTITLNKLIKSHYSEAQRTKIAAMFTAKKWTLVW